mgnify:CR=1 FL=1
MITLLAEAFLQPRLVAHVCGAVVSANKQGDQA